MSWKTIAQYNRAIEALHQKGNHSRCTVDDCYYVDEANQAHKKGTHDDTYCVPTTCKVVAKSHQTDHTMCSPENCKIVGAKHKNDDHSICNSYSCWAKEQVSFAHNFKMHCLDCSPYTCPDVAQSHATNHALCNSRWCEQIAGLHNDGDHSLCHPSWCLAKQSNLHESNDHSFCRIFDCDQVKDNKYWTNTLEKLDPGDEE